MKKNFIQIMVTLFAMISASCADPPNNSESVQQPDAEQEIYQVGDVRFTAWRIPIEGIWVAAADLNNDGHLDLVGGGQPNLTIYLGDGTGTLTEFSQAPSGQQPDHFILADLNEDGNADIVIANHETDHLTILHGNGDGTFQSAANSPLRIPVDPHPHEVRAADLNADGHLDLIVDNRNAPGYLILAGRGDGGFEASESVEVAGDPYRGMALGDLDGDGDLDLVSPDPNEAGILFNESQEEIAFTPGNAVPAQTPFVVALGDFNGDGNLDLISGTDENSPLVELFWGDGSGGFEPVDTSPYTLAAGGKQIVVGDFNGDGMDDAAVSAYRSAEVLVLLGGRTTLQTGVLLGIEHPWGFAAADLNADGIDDLVIGDDVHPDAVIYLSQRP